MKNKWTGLGILAMADSLLVILMVMGMMAVLSSGRFITQGMIVFVILPLATSFLVHRLPVIIDDSGFDLFEFDMSMVRYAFAIPLAIVITFLSWVTRSYIGLTWGVTAIFIAFVMVGYEKKRHLSKTMLIHVLVSWAILALPFIFIFEEI